MALIEKKTIINNEIDYEKLADIIIQSKQIDINYDKLASSFLEAIDKKKEETKKIEIENREKHREETLHKLGAGKDDMTNNKVRNFIKQFIAILRIKREHQYYNNVIVELKKTMSQAFFKLLEFSLIMLGFWLIVKSAFHTSLLDRISNSLFGFSFVFFSNVFRIAGYEVETMQDDNKINETFMSVLTFISMIAAIVATVLAFTAM